MPANENLEILWRGVRCRCPQCGQGRLFKRWGIVHERCAACGLRLNTREPDTWFIMYVSMAVITGVFLIGLLWVFPTPANKWLGRIVMGSAALGIFFGSAPMRKGLAIALDYLSDLRGHNHEGLEFRK